MALGCAVTCHLGCPAGSTCVLSPGCITASQIRTYAYSAIKARIRFAVTGLFADKCGDSIYFLARASIQADYLKVVRGIPAQLGESIAAVIGIYPDVRRVGVGNGTPG